MKGNKRKWVERLFWIISIAIVWQMISAIGWFSPLIFPPLEEIFKRLYDSLMNGELLEQSLFSLLLIFKGLIISMIIALVLTLLSLISRTFASLLETILAIAHPLPGIALMPLILIWLGAGTSAITFIIIHSVLWPMVLNLLTGFKSIDRIYTLVGRNYGLNSLQIMLSIKIPASLPYFIAGIKIGWARAWRALISAEMLFGAAGSGGGLGWFIFKRRVFFDLPGVFAGLIIIIFIGLFVEDFLFHKLEEVTVKKWGMQL